jgi:hypothetical protein
MRLAVEPHGAAMFEFVRLGEVEEELLARVDRVGAEARLAAAELAAVREELTELERKAGAGGPSAQQRAAVEKRLVRAEEAARQPWAERRAGAERAARDGRQAIQRHAAKHLDELVAEIEEAGVAAAEQVDYAAEAFVAAVERRAQVDRILTEVVALTRPMSPGDITRSGADEAVAAVRTLLERGGEVPPALRITVPMSV